jgi:NAD-dependent SIR2 family protein deacetylase
MAEDLKAESIPERPITEEIKSRLELAAEKIKNAEALIVHFGAGMSADSGLPIYRDIATHPAYKEYGLDYPTLCDPVWITKDPEIFYGFWGDCFNKYRKTAPHEGYHIIKRWRENMFSTDSPAAQEKFDGWRSTFAIMSSNVDGHAQTAGIPDEEVDEVHGTIEYWQCSEVCCQEVWKAPDSFEFEVDLKTMKAPNKETASKVKGFETNHPTCIYCGKLARPAILMFGDGCWIDPQERKKLDHPQHYHIEVKKLKLVVIEIGAGTNVPTIRWSTETYRRSSPRDDVTIFRVNPFESHFPSRFANDKNCVSINLGGLQTLKQIDELMKNLNNSK